MAVATPTPDESRERLLNALFPPVREMVRAVDEIKAAWAARDLDRIGRAIRDADGKVDDYLKAVQG